MPACDGAATQPSTPEPATFFHGLVVDADSQPVAKAEISVTTAELATNRETGGHVPDRATQRTFKVHSSKNGKFMVTLPKRHNFLAIDGVAKDGYEFVHDWAWTLGPPHDTASNRKFTFASSKVRCPAYQSDVKRPAIFPLHRTDDQHAATRPSRGGVDVDCDGNQRVNEPSELFVPSAGKGAARTQKEIEEGIKSYLSARLK